MKKQVTLGSDAQARGIVLDGESEDVSKLEDKGESESARRLAHQRKVLRSQKVKEEMIRHSVFRHLRLDFRYGQPGRTHRR